MTPYVHTLMYNGDRCEYIEQAINQWICANNAIVLSIIPIKPEVVLILYDHA